MEVTTPQTEKMNLDSQPFGIDQQLDLQMEDSIHQTEKMNLDSQPSGTDHMSELPTEMLRAILERCETKDLLSLARVAKYVGREATSIIYNHIDLSSHNRGDLLCTFPTPARWTFVYWKESSDSVKCNLLPPNLRTKQRAFISTILHNPTLANLVTSLTWTLVASQPRKETYLTTPDPLQKTWTAFTHLNSVQHLDLAWLPRHSPTTLTPHFPPTLFPSLTTLRLTGHMPYALAASILLPSAPKLTTLTLNNLQQSGQIHRAHHAQTLQRHNNPTHSELAAGTYFTHPGPMQNLLSAVSGKCTSLHTLHLRKVGQRDQFDYSDHWTQHPLSPVYSFTQDADMRAWLEQLDRDVYAEWGAFLKSVKGTLRVLGVEVGERMRPRMWEAQPRVRPMDRRFGRWVFPVICGGTGGLPVVFGKRGGWDRLERLGIEGVQGWEMWLKKNDTVNGAAGGMFVNVEGELKRVLGERVEVSVREAAREADHAALVRACEGRGWGWEDGDGGNFWPCDECWARGGERCECGDV